MIRAGIIQSFAIGDEDTEQRAQVEKLMPVPVIAGEPRSVKTDDQTGMTQSDLGDQLLEAQPLSTGGSRFAEIVVDHAYTLSWPAERYGAIHEPILQFRTFLMMPHLTDRGLTDVNIRRLAAMGIRQMLIRTIGSAQHDGSPLSDRRVGASATACSRERGPIEFCCPRAGSAKDAAASLLAVVVRELETLHDA